MYTAIYIVPTRALENCPIGRLLDIHEIECDNIFLYFKPCSVHPFFILCYKTLAMNDKFFIFISRMCVYSLIV